MFTFNGPWEVKRVSIQDFLIGMYCVRENSSGEPCFTQVSEDGKHVDYEVNLKAGECLIMDNRWWHGRRGPVGDRLLIRFWLTKSPTPIAAGV